MCTILLLPTDIILQIQVPYCRRSLLALSTWGTVLVTTTFDQFENEAMWTILRVPRILRLPSDIILPTQVLSIFSSYSLFAKIIWQAQFRLITQKQRRLNDKTLTPKKLRTPPPSYTLSIYIIPFLHYSGCQNRHAIYKYTHSLCCSVSSPFSLTKKLTIFLSLSVNFTLRTTLLLAHYLNHLHNNSLAH